MRSILNFAPAALAVPEGVSVRKVDLAVELQILTYYEQRKAALEEVATAMSWIDELLAYGLGGLGGDLVVASIVIQVMSIVKGDVSNALVATLGVALGAVLYRWGFGLARRARLEGSRPAEDGRYFEIVNQSVMKMARTITPNRMNCTEPCSSSGADS